MCACVRVCVCVCVYTHTSDVGANVVIENKVLYIDFLLLICRNRYSTEEIRQISIFFSFFKSYKLLSLRKQVSCDFYIGA